MNPDAGSQYWRGWTCYFAALLSIAIFLTGTPVQDWLLSLQTSAETIATLHKYGDPGTFASAAAEVKQYGWLVESSLWIFNLWPPGFVLLEAGLLKLFGSNAPMPLLLLLLSTGLFAVVMLEMRRILASSFGPWAWWMPLLIFCFSEGRVFLLSPVGLLLGEWLAIGSFLLGVLLLVRKTVKAAILAGILFAISTYTRSQFEFFLNVILLVSAGLPVAKYCCNRPLKFNGWQAGKFLLMSMVVAQVLMMPWRLYHLQDGRGLRWVSTGDVIIQNGLSSDIALQEKSGSFVILGGGNVACHLAPEHCGKADSRIFFNIFLEHPVAWMKEKIQLLPKYWFAPIGALDVPRSSPDLLDIVLKSVLLFALILSAPLLWLIRKAAVAQLWASVGLGLLAAHFFIILFAHLEVRYFFFIKIYGVFSLLLLSVPVLDYIARTKERNTAGDLAIRRTRGREK